MDSDSSVCACRVCCAAARNQSKRLLGPTGLHESSQMVQNGKRNAFNIQILMMRDVCGDSYGAQGEEP